MRKISAGDEDGTAVQAVNRFGNGFAQTVMFSGGLAGQSDADHFDLVEGQELPEEIERDHRTMIELVMAGSLQAGRDFFFSAGFCDGTGQFCIVGDADPDFRCAELAKISLRARAR